MQENLLLVTASNGGITWGDALEMSVPERRILIGLIQEAREAAQERSKVVPPLPKFAHGRAYVVR